MKRVRYIGTCNKLPAAILGSSQSSKGLCTCASDVSQIGQHVMCVTDDVTYLSNEFIWIIIKETIINKLIRPQHIYTYVYLTSSRDKHKVGKISRNTMNSMWGLSTLYVGLISTHELMYVIQFLYTSSVRYPPWHLIPTKLIIGVSRTRDEWDLKYSAKERYSSPE